MMMHHAVLRSSERPHGHSGDLAEGLVAGRVAAGFRRAGPRDRRGRPLAGIVFLLVTALAATSLGQADTARQAQALGKARAAVEPLPDGTIVCEAEEFQVAEPGWQARNWGENYYAATLANTFLSRKAFLGAPEQCDATTASIQVRVATAGSYLALVRYEAAYRFETQFRLRIEQAGRVLLDRRYGARDNVKIWAFGQKLKKEVRWEWGAVENVVWEGHDALVQLAAGPATISLIAERQGEPAARRNVDLVMLTTDVEQVKTRIEKERYLPLDGMLTQAGDLFMRVHNHGGVALEVSGHKFPAGTCQQHSPYWVHMRNWQPLAPVRVAGGQASDWVEVGSLLDTLNDGQWGVQVAPPSECTIEFGVPDARGRIETINQFRGRLGDLPLAFHADTRYSRQLRHRREVLTDLMEFLAAQPADGPAPRRTPIYGYTFPTGLDAAHDRQVAQLKALYGLTDTQEQASGGPPRGYIDVRGVPTAGLNEHCRQLGDRARQMLVVSLGDEIGLPRPPAGQPEDFRAWLKSQGVAPRDLHPAWGDDFSKVVFDLDDGLRETQPGTYYWSRRYRHHFGIQAIKQRTDLLRAALPAAHIGANYSPHYPLDHAYLGEVFKWVTCFRHDGMTLPWSEDYIWQIPVGSPQMNNINLDLFRAGLRGKPDRQIMYYVMPHWPGNTPRTWRRLFFGALGHGMTMVNLFEFRPVQVAYTENHVSHNEMYAEVLRSFRQLARFEDIVQEGRVRDGQAALWFSETADIWQDNRGPFAPAKRALYTAIRHQQVPLDFVVEQDAADGTLDRYRLLYLTDAHVSQAASQKIAAWVAAGGRLLATAGAGMFDEYHRPNTTLRKLLGVEPTALTDHTSGQFHFIKQDLPFAAAIDEIAWSSGQGTEALPVFAVQSRFQTAAANVVGTFRDGGPAIVTRQVDRGQATYCGFLPGLTYYQPAIPLRPVHRSSHDDAMNHFLPSDFHAAASRLIGQPAADLELPVRCSQPLVEATIIESPAGVAVPLVNWSPQAARGLVVTLKPALPFRRVTLASGQPLQVTTDGNQQTIVLDLDVADTVLLRN